MIYLLLIILLIIIIIQAYRNIRFFYDNQLGIYNRFYLNKKVQKYIMNKHNGLLIMIDVNNFKQINDFHSHLIGDDILKQIVKVIQKTFNDDDITLIRYGGDEFILIINNISIIEDHKLTTLNECLHQVALDHKLVMDLSVSLGACAFKAKDDLCNIISDADQIMYLAKANKKISNIVYYNDKHQQSNNFKRQLSMDLDNLFTKNELILLAQPINLYTNNSYAIASYEILCRWQHPEYGIITPDIFLALIKSEALIAKLDMYVIKRTFIEVMPLLADNIRVSINISPLSIISYHEQLISLLKELLIKTKVNPQRIILEITEESAIENYDLFKKFFKAVNDLEIRFALDDYGQKYADVKRLSQLYFSFIKLDQFFVADILKNKRKQVIIKNLVVMMEELQASVLIEGVENIDQLNLLRELGVKLFQGYYFARPQSLEEIASNTNHISYDITQQIYQDNNLSKVEKELF